MQTDAHFLMIWNLFANDEKGPVYLKILPTGLNIPVVLV